MDELYHTFRQLYTILVYGGYMENKSLNGKKYFITFWCDLGNENNGASIWEEYLEAVVRLFPGKEGGDKMRDLGIESLQIWWAELPFRISNPMDYVKITHGKLLEPAIYRYQMAPYMLNRELPEVKGDYIAVLAMGPFDLETLEKVSEHIDGAGYPKSHLVATMGTTDYDRKSLINVHEELRLIFEVEGRIARFFTGDYPVGTLLLEELGYEVERHPDNIYG